MASGRQTIKQRIALDGGKEIQDQLKGLGEAGEKAFEQIRKAALKADLAKFGDSLGKFSSDLATVGRRFALAFGATVTAATAAGAAVFGLAVSSAEQADEAGKAAQATGLQVDAYGRLSFAAKMANVSQEEFQAGMSKLNLAIEEAASAGTTASGKLAAAAKKTGSSIEEHIGFSVETFDQIGVRVTRFGQEMEKAGNKAKKAGEVTESAFVKLGIRVKDANGNLRSTEDILGDIAEAFSRLPDGPEKAAIAIDLFGRSGANLLPFLNQGRKGLKELGLEAERLGVVFTKEQAAIGDALGDALDGVKEAVGGTKKQLGLLFAPAVTVAAEAFRDLIVQNRAAIVEFGRVVALWGVRLVRDLINALAGNDAAVRQPWILVWRDAIIDFGRNVQTVVQTVILPWFRAVQEGARLVANAINAVFGTEISGRQLLIGAALLKLLGVFKLVGSGARLLIASLRLVGSALAFAFSGGIIATIGRFGSLLATAGAAAGGFWGILVRGATVFAGLVAGLVSWPALLVAAVVAAGAAIFIFWDEIVASAQAAIARIQQFFSAENLAGVFEGLRSGAAQAGQLFVELWRLQIEAVAALFRSLGEIIAGFVQGVIAGIGSLVTELQPVWDQILAAGSSIWGGISAAASATWDAIVAGATAIFTRISGVFSAGLEIVRAAFQPIADLVASIWSSATEGIAAAAQAITDAIANASSIAGDLEGAAELATALVQPFQDASTEIDRIFAAIRNMAVRGFNAIRSEVGNIAQSIEAMIARILAALRQAAAAAARLKAQASSSGSSSSSSASTFAGGGSVRGAGTGTSDSIPAWLSNGEFVIRAAAVRKFGAGFFAALNSLRMPKGFSVGGMVSGFERSMSSLMPVQRFANGGPVLAPAAGGISGRPISLTFEGETFDMVADESVAEKLQRFATGKAMRSTGRKPGWR